MTNAREARLILRAHRYGALCTLSKKFNGHPFGSITSYLVDHDGSLLILISTLAEHTRNIQHDPRVSLITHDQRDTHIQSQGRVTVVGNARLEPDREKTAQRYLRYFPEAKTYLGMHDFDFYRIRPDAIRYIGGFGKIHWIDKDQYWVAQAELFAQREEDLLAEINARRQTYLHHPIQQLGLDSTNVFAIGLDCDGLDMRSADRIWRLNFAEAPPHPTLDALASLQYSG